MLTADPHYKAPEIEIPIGVSGTYRIFIGINYFFQTWKTSSYGSIWLKLPEDPGFSRVGMERYDLHAEGKYWPKIKPDKATKESYNTIYEVYWKTADLTGKNLTVCMPQPP